MLRPERMSRVSVTGAKAVMVDVIEALHDLHLVHLVDYDGSWDGFDHGNPLSGADDASEKLVTVRSIESILDVDVDDAGPTRIIDDEVLSAELPAVRADVNELDDRRSELRDELRHVEERLDGIEPFAMLGIDLEFLSGYDSLEVAVGYGDENAVAATVSAADAIDAYDTFAADGVVAVFARLVDDAENSLDDVLVGTAFTAVEVPDADGSPEEYVKELEKRKKSLESKLARVQAELEELKLDAAGFLLAAEETLTIDVQKTEAPLTFATTNRSFIAEGWIPTDRYDEVVRALNDAADGRVEVEELERATYHEHGNGGTHSEAVADGGTTMSTGSPPVVQDNPGYAQPFEVLVQAVSRPTYTELDPTVLLFLTFPAFFGFMIGDLGYGILYTAIGYYIYTNVEGEAFKSLGGITLWAGGFTMLFGVLYGEIFGLHQLGDLVWKGTPPIEKGLSPATAEYALTWLVVSVIVGILHLNVGYAFDFVERLDHGLRDAVTESGSWMLLMNGVWVWIFSVHSQAQKPEFIYEVFAGDPFSLGFHGFPELYGLIGLAIAAVGLVLLVIGEGGVGLIESLNVLVNVLSYARITAVLLAKAGMAFVVNLLFFGVFVTGRGENAVWHFGITKMFTEADVAQGVMYHGHEVTDITFGGLMHNGVGGIAAGLAILVLGHALVLALGITSAGLQAVRLEYVEFFGKFYEGGGNAYEPFGHARTYTTED